MIFIYFYICLFDDMPSKKKPAKKITKQIVEEKEKFNNVEKELFSIQFDAKEKTIARLSYCIA